jgi:Secretion system C-terminal sorting domain
MKHLFFALLLLPYCAYAQPKKWQVGPTRTYKVPSAVAGLVANGDTVDIDAGLYTGDVASWYASSLVIRGVGGGYAHLEANGQHAEGKAIWVVKGAQCRIEGIKFTGCKVPDQNGAGIRQEGKDLFLSHCAFLQNEMGILTNNDGVSNDVFESCEFGFNGYGDGYSHNIYVGHINSLILRYCYSHDAHVGHLVKSRAEENYFYYNRFTGEQGDGSYEIDLPNGGKAILIGNIIEQSANSQNGGIIAFGLEGATNLNQIIGLSHNTIWNRRFNGRFLHYSNQNYTAKLINNLFLGEGTLLTGVTTYLDTTKNLILTDTAAARLQNLAQYQFRPLSNSPLLNAGTFTGQDLRANDHYIHPLGVEMRTLHGSLPDIGAYEYAPPTVTKEAASANLYHFTISPNPTQKTLTLSAEKPLSHGTLRVFDLNGSCVLHQTMTQLLVQSFEIGHLAAGAYAVQIIDGGGDVVFVGRVMKI